MDAGQENVDKEIKELLHSLEILILFASILIAVSISIPSTSSHLSANSFQQIVSALILLISFAFAFLFLAYSIKKADAVYLATISMALLIIEIMLNFIVLSIASGNNTTAYIYYVSFIPLDFAFIYYFYTKAINTITKAEKDFILISLISFVFAFVAALSSIYFLSGLKSTPINKISYVVFIIFFIGIPIYVYKKSHLKIVFRRRNRTKKKTKEEKPLE